MDLAFADDIVLIAGSEEHLQHNADIWAQAMERRNMIISPEKNKTMVVSNQDRMH